MVLPMVVAVMVYFTVNPTAPDHAPAWLLHQAIPVTTGFIAGVDAVLAAVLLVRSLRARSRTPR